ncbi:mCG144869, partial [Mus musculus]
WSSHWPPTPQPTILQRKATELLSLSPIHVSSPSCWPNFTSALKHFCYGKSPHYILFKSPNILSSDSTPSASFHGQLPKTQSCYPCLKTSCAGQGGGSIGKCHQI